MKLFGTQGTRVAKKPQKRKKKSRVLKHMKSLGFTNRLAVYILLFLAAGLAGVVIGNSLPVKCGR